MHSASKILVVVTGGTIEALYSPEKGTPFIVPLPHDVEGSAIPEALAKLGLDHYCHVLKHSMQDSKSICAEEAYGLFKDIEHSGATQAVFICGTDAMPAIGRYFQALWKKTLLGEQLKIMLTGAMQPLRDERGCWREASDGWCNLRCAIEAAQNPYVAAGVYVEMGQGLMDPGYLIKEVQAEWRDKGHAGDLGQYVARSQMVKTKEKQAAADIFSYPKI